MKKRSLVSATLLSCLLAAPMAQAHIVGLGYTFIDDEIRFDVLHWHDNHHPAGFLNVNGVNHAFTSATFDTNYMTNLDGALINSSYSAYDADTGTLSAIGTAVNISAPGDGIVNDWLSVTITNPGTEIISLSTVFGPGGLTAWTLDDSIVQLDIVQPPETPNPIAQVPEPSTLLLLGAGLMGMASRRKRKSV